MVTVLAGVLHITIQLRVQERPSLSEQKGKLSLLVSLRLNHAKRSGAPACKRLKTKRGGEKTNHYNKVFLDTIREIKPERMG